MGSERNDSPEAQERRLTNERLVGPGHPVNEGLAPPRRPVPAPPPVPPPLPEPTKEQGKPVEAQA
jgi:hypothetical protein